MKYKKFFFLCLILISFTFKGVLANENCSDNNIINSYKNYKIKNLSIDILDQRKWHKNLYRAILEEDRVFLKKKYKKRFKAKLILYYSAKQKCELNAMVRLHGDESQHYVKSPPSLSVKIKDGNLNNFTDFILFRPDSKGADDEIFTSTLAKYLGFISPDTFYVNVSFNGKIFKYLLQERAAKELIESFKMREGPLLEGDERHVYDEKIDQKEIFKMAKGLVRMDNSNWAIKSKSNLDISLNILENLNYVYQDHLINLNNNSTKYFYNFDLIKNISDESLEKLEMYHVFLYSIKGVHGLVYHNRKFYFDYINNIIHPIFYDTDSRILTFKKKANFKLKKELILEKDLSDRVNELLYLIDNISIDIFRKELEIKGLKISEEKILKTFLRIKNNLNIISNLEIKNNLAKQNKRLFETVGDLKHINIGFYNKKTKILEYCDLYLNSCEKEMLSSKNLKKLVEQRLRTKNNVDIVFVSNDKVEYKKNTLKGINSIENKYSKVRLDDFNVYFKNALIEKNLEEKVLKIKAQSPNDIVVISGKKVEDWKIYYNGFYPTKTFLYPFGFTGCLNILAKEISIKEIKVSNANCEDAVNFIRTTGDVKNLQIDNSFSDGIDADFSNINFKNIIINKSLNDCADFSYGNYSIENINVKNCGDKGVSVGEASNVNIQNLKAYNSNIGVASKDSSNVNLKSADFFEVESCISIYNKKNEFNSASLKMQNNLYCKNKLYVQKGSVLNLEK